MTGHLWCHASTVCASLLHRNWFHWLSDLGYQTQDTFCDINNILWPCIHMKEDKFKSFAVRTNLLFSIRNKVISKFVQLQKNTDVAYMCNCSHTHTALVMYYHTCISQSSTHHLLLLQRAIFELRRCLSLWRNPIVLQTCWTLKTRLCPFWWDFNSLTSRFKSSSKQENCGESTREISTAVTLITKCFHELQLLYGQREATAVEVSCLLDPR